MKVTYTEEAIADLVEAITYLNERNPTAAANLDAEISRCIDRLAAQEFEGPAPAENSVLVATVDVAAYDRYAFRR